MRGGSGWLKKSATYNRNLKDLLDLNDIDFSLYDIVTIALGVNDWKGGETFGSISDSPSSANTVYSNMKYCIEYIIAKNPNIKIFVISPINTAWDVSSQSSLKSHNWGIGYSREVETTGKTLEDMFNLEKEVCEYYGIEFIDMLHKSIINRENINQMLLDKVHPTIEAHKQMGRQIARLI